VKNVTFTAPPVRFFRGPGTPIPGRPAGRNSEPSNAFSEPVLGGMSTSRRSVPIPVAGSPAVRQSTSTAPVSPTSDNRTNCQAVKQPSRRPRYRQRVSRVPARSYDKTQSFLRVGEPIAGVRVSWVGSAPLRSMARPFRAFNTAFSRSGRRVVGAPLRPSRRRSAVARRSSPGGGEVFTHTAGIGRGRRVAPRLPRSPRPVRRARFLPSRYKHWSKRSSERS